MKKALFSAVMILFLGAGCFSSNDNGNVNGNMNVNSNSNSNSNLNANENSNENYNANSNANGNKNGNSNSNSNSNANGNGNSNVNAAVKFSSQDYYRFSYLISGSTLSSAAKAATAGFSITHKSNSDGTVTYTIHPLTSGLQDKMIVLRSGQKLYFIDKILTDDDSTADTDANPTDDTVVVVDAAGNVVSGPTGW